MDVVFNAAAHFNQDPFCGPSWVDSEARNVRMFSQVTKGSISNKPCCPAGTYRIEGTSKCTRCAIGKYNSKTGSSAESACKDCAAGEYNNEQGMSACRDCAS